MKWWMTAYTVDELKNGENNGFEVDLPLNNYIICSSIKSMDKRERYHHFSSKQWVRSGQFEDVSCNDHLCNVFNRWNSYPHFCRVRFIVNCNLDKMALMFMEVK